MSAVDVLKVAEAYINETDYTVWSDLSLSLGTQGLLIQSTDATDEMKAYNRNLYSKVFQSLGWEAKENEGTVMFKLMQIYFKWRLQDYCRESKTYMLIVDIY